MNKFTISLLILILLILLSSVISFAEIRKVSVYGTEEIDGYRRVVNDKTLILVEGKLSGESELTPNQFRIFAEGKTTLFKEPCTKLADGYTRCIYTTTTNTMEDFAKVYPFSVQLFTDANSLADEKRISLTYDNQPPKIKVESITQNKDNVQVGVSFEDIACLEPGCEGKCSGLQSVEVDGKQIGSNLTGCSSYQVLSIPAKEEGYRTFTIKAKDKLNQISTKITNPFYVDINDPLIEKLSFEVDGQPIKYIGEDGIRSAWLRVTIKERDLSNLVTDLSQLNIIPEFQTMYKNKESSCARMSQDRFQCIFREIYLLPEKENGVLIFNITDSAGRFVSQSVQYSLPIDKNKPNIKRITTSGCKDNTCYVSLYNNVIRADIEEKGAGFTPFTYVNGEPRYHVGIDAHELSPSYGVIWADNCTGSGGSWFCLWNGLNAVGPHMRTFTILIPAISTDDAGNSFTGESIKRVVVDSVPPILLSANVSSQTGDILVEGTPLSMQAVLEDDTNILGKAYVESVVGIKEPVAVECIPQGDNKHICSWNQIANLLPGPIKSAKITLLFLDLAGNSINKTLFVTVLASDKEKKNYWSLGGKAVPMPKVLDKDTLFFEQRVYFNVPLYGPDNSRIIDGAITNCADNNGFSSVRIISGDSKNLILQATVGPLSADATLSKIKAKCTAVLVTVVNEERLAQPQELVVPLEIQLVSGIGSLDSNVQQKIDDAKNWDLYGLRKIYDPLEKLYKVAEQICNGLNMFSQANLGGLMGMSGNPMAMASNAAMQSNNEMFSTMFKYCQYLSCDKTIWGNWYNDMIKEPEMSKKMHLGATAWPQNPKDNLFLSMTTGCIPGILYNLNKYKQIQCTYVDCLQNQVPLGVPMQFCVNQNEYLKCRFMYGQMFDLIPFSHFVKRMSTYVKTIFANPLSMAFGLGSFACEQRYAAVGPDGMLCSLARTLPQALSLVSQFQSFGNFQQGLNAQNQVQNVCSKVNMG